MAFPQVEATNNSAEAVVTMTHSVALPANIQAGETLLVFFVTDRDPTPATPAGWTNLIDKANGTAVNLAIYYRKADGGEGASVTITTTDARESVHVSYRISGATDPTVTAPEVSTGAVALNANPDPDELTPGGGSKEYLWIAVEGNDDDDATTVYPTDYTNGETHLGGIRCNIGIARRELETTVQDPGTFTIAAAEEWAACTVAVYPALAAGLENKSANMGLKMVAAGLI